MTVVVERKTKVDTKRLHALIASSVVTGRPKLDDLQRVELQVPLQPGEDAKKVVLGVRKRVLSSSSSRIRLK